MSCHHCGHAANAHGDSLLPPGCTVIEDGHLARKHGQPKTTSQPSSAVPCRRRQRLAMLTAMSMAGMRPTILRLSAVGLWTLALASCHESSTSASPSLSLSVSPDGQALVGVTQVAFTATVSDPSGGSLDVNWDFGDGQTASGPSVVHLYAREGVFAVGVTVTSGHGGSAAAGTTVTVGDLTGRWSLSEGGGKFYEWGFDITQAGAALGGRPYAVPDHGCTGDIAGALKSPRTLRFEFVACDGNTVVVDGSVAGDLRSIPGTYTHPDGPPQPMVLSRQ